MAPTLATSSNYPTFPQAQTMAEFPPACHDMLHWDELLTDKERETKYKVRKFMVRAAPSATLHCFACMPAFRHAYVASFTSLQLCLQPEMLSVSAHFYAHDARQRKKFKLQQFLAVGFTQLQAILGGQAISPHMPCMTVARTCSI